MPPAARPRNLSQTHNRQTADPRNPVSASEITLQRANLEVSPEIGFYSLRRGDGSRKSGVVGDFMQEGSAPQRPAVCQCHCTFCGVENQLDPPIPDRIDDVWAAFGNLVDLFRLHSFGDQISLGP